MTIKRFLETNENETMSYQNLWVLVPGIQRKVRSYAIMYGEGKEVATKVTTQLKKQEKDPHKGPGAGRRREINKRRAEINELKSKKQSKDELNQVLILCRISKRNHQQDSQREKQT